MAFPSLTSGIFSAATGGVADEAAQAAQAFRDSSTAVDQDSSALIAPPVDNTPLSWTQPGAIQPGAIQPGAIQPWTPTPFAGEAYKPAPTPVWTPKGMTTTDPDNPYVRPDPPPPPVPVYKDGAPENPMPSGFKAPTGAVTLALVPFFNPTTGETWIAPSGGYTPGPGWQRSSDQEFTPTTTPPTTTPPTTTPPTTTPPTTTPGRPFGFTYDEGRGGFKVDPTTGALTIDRDSAINAGWTDDEDGDWSWSLRDFLADAYAHNSPNGVYGELGNGYFIRLVDDDDDENTISSYELYNSNAVGRSMGGYLDRGVGSLGPSYL
jgi:hypothetical protein